MSSKIFLGETGDIGKTLIIRLKDLLSVKQNQLAEKGKTWTYLIEISGNPKNFQRKK